MCDENKQVIDERIKKIRAKFKLMIMKNEATHYKKKIVEEMARDLEKHFNKEIFFSRISNFWE